MNERDVKLGLKPRRAKAFLFDRPSVGQPAPDAVQLRLDLFPVSDVKTVTVTHDAIGAIGAVLLGVVDQDGFEDGRPLTTAVLAPSQAVKLARMLLLQAGVEGVKVGNATHYTFID